MLDYLWARRSDRRRPSEPEGKACSLREMEDLLQLTYVLRTTVPDPLDYAITQLSRTQ